MIAGGLSVLSKEFPAAQRLIDFCTTKIRNFAENENSNVTTSKGEEGEQKEDCDEPVKKSKGGLKESLRKLARFQLLPLFLRISSRQEVEIDGETKDLNDVNEIFV